MPYAGRTALHRRDYASEARDLVNFNQADTGGIVVPTNNRGVVARGNGNGYCGLQIVWRLTTAILDLGLLRILPVVVKSNNCSITAFNCRVGSCRAFATPNEVRVGPSARTTRFIEPLAPLTIKPPIITLLPVWTRPRVDMLDSCDVESTSTS